MLLYDSETGVRVNHSLAAIVWDHNMASAWTGVWDSAQRKRLCAGLMSGDGHEVDRVRAAAQLRDINSVMTAIMSLLTERRHEHRTQLRAAERAALMGQDEQERPGRHIEGNAVWALYSLNKERRGAKSSRQVDRLLVATATDVNTALNDDAMVPPLKAALTPEEPEDDATAEHEDGDWLQNTPEVELRGQVEMERAQEHYHEGESGDCRDDTEELEDTRAEAGPPRHLITHLDDSTHIGT